jgi:drug/metabolite transporter (DMT)-like permease
VQFATVAAVGGLLCLFLPLPQFHVGGVAAAALGYCVIFPTIICFTLQNTFQRYTTPTQAGLIYTLDPVWSMLGGFAILGERLGRQEWLGCTLIFSAVLVPLVARYIREQRLTVRGMVEEGLETMGEGQVEGDVRR